MTLSRGQLVEEIPTYLRVDIGSGSRYASSFEC